MKHFIFLVLLFVMMLPISILAIEPGQEETISLTDDMPLNSALQALETLSVKYTGRKLMNLSNSNDPIGIPIHQLTWKQALDLIALKQGLIIDEQNGVVIVKSPISIEKTNEDVTLNTEQVRISSIAFVADKSFLNALGIDWSTLLKGKVTANFNFNGAVGVPSSLMNSGFSKGWATGQQRIDVSTVLKVIETNQKGSVIAKPTLVVASGKRGYIQVGQDFSVKQKDEAGNVTDKFYSTGVIMDVMPIIITDSGKEAIHLIARVERSSAVPGDITTIINKSQSTTDLVMFDGEETVIGGLYDTEDTRERGGIPLLKDLPWWVFGIRFLTGYDKITKTEKEMVIIIKAEIVGSAKDRMVIGNSSSPEKEKVFNYMDSIQEIPQIVPDNTKAESSDNKPSPQTFNWGMKYGAGVGSIWGNELNYKLRYEFYIQDSDQSLHPMGRYTNTSKHGSIGTSQNLGLFFSFPMHQAATTILLQPEILWQRYSYSYSFDNQYPDFIEYNSDSIVVSLFNHSLTGYVDTQLDYVTVPILLMLQQNISRYTEKRTKKFSVFSYVGPSFSFLMNHKNNRSPRLDDLEDDMNQLVLDSQNDTDNYHSFIYKKISTATDDMLNLKYGFIVGFGWKLNDLYQWDIGKNEWSLDFRFDFNINDLSDTMTNSDFQLYSSTVSLGYRF